MKKALLTSVLFFVLIGIGFSQWERINMPGNRYYPTELIQFKDKLVLKESHQYYISDIDSIFWEKIDLAYSIKAVKDGTAYALDLDEDGRQTIYTSTNLIRWNGFHTKVHNPVYPFNGIRDEFGELVYFSGKYAVSYPEQEYLYVDTSLTYFSSQSHFSQNFDKPISRYVTGRRDENATVAETNQHVCTGRQFEYINFLTDRVLTKTPDDKRYVIEYKGNLKEKIRHDQYRYVIRDSNLLAKDFIISPIESVLIGEDTLSKKHFVATYSNDSEWQIIFDSNEQLPFSKVDDGYLYGVDSFHLYALNLRTTEMNTFAFAKYPGYKFFVRRYGGHFYLLGNEGVQRLDNDGQWKPTNDGLTIKSNFGQLFIDEEKLITYITHKRTVQISDDLGASWQNYQVDTFVTNTPNNHALGIYFEGNQSLLILNEGMYVCDEKMKNCELKYKPDNRPANTFRYEEKIVAAPPNRSELYISDDFGNTWQTVQTGDFYYNFINQKKDTIFFFDRNQIFNYSYDFGKTWNQELVDFNYPSFIGFEKGDNLFAFVRERKKIKGMSARDVRSYYTKKLGKTEWTWQYSLPDHNNWQSSFFRDENHWYSLSGNQTVFSKEDKRYIPRAFRRNGLPYGQSNQIEGIIKNKIIVQHYREGVYMYELKR